VRNWANLLDGREVLRPHEERRWCGIVHDRRDLGRREPIVDWGKHLPGLCRAKEDLVEGVGVLVEQGNPCPRRLVDRAQAVGHLAGRAIKLPVACLAPLEHQRHVVGLGSGFVAEDAGEIHEKGRHDSLLSADGRAG
jgi:hypothetical protein